jgi:hypothetical protein
MWAQRLYAWEGVLIPATLSHKTRSLFGWAAAMRATGGGLPLVS